MNRSRIFLSLSYEKDAFSRIIVDVVVGAEVAESHMSR